MKIEYFFNFKEENRTSMNMLGNLLFYGFKRNRSIRTSKFVPKLSFITKLFISSILSMRVERYILYPLQVFFKKKTDIAHVIDHQYSHLVNVLNSKIKIITINDLIPLIFAKRLNKNPVLLKYSLNQIYKFDHILSLSYQTKKDLIKYYRINENKITVIYPVVEKIFNNNKFDKIKINEKFSFPTDHKKIIVFDTVFYKNFSFSLNIFKKIIKKYPKCIMVKIGDNYKKKINFKINKKIYQINNLDRAQMADLYKSSDLLLFPSLYEGYGLPCVEAMKCGLPVVGSGRASLKEILSINSQFSLNNKDGIVRHILKIFKKKNYYLKQKKISLNQAKKFTYEKYFAEVNKIYERYRN